MPTYDSDGLEIPQPKEEDLEFVSELGGEFDEAQYYIEFYGESLVKDVISKALNIVPTIAYEAGERHPVGNSGFTSIKKYGKWMLKVKVNDGTISDALKDFFDGNAASLELWKEFAGKWEGRVALVGNAKNWNREFTVSSEVVKAIAERGLEINFDAYFESLSDQLKNKMTTEEQK